jgi:hypothetical protein
MLNFGGRLGQPKKTKLILFLFNRWWIFDFETDFFLYVHVLWRTINLGRPVIELTSKCEAGIMFN